MKTREQIEQDRSNRLLAPLLHSLERNRGDDGVQTVTDYYFEEALGISRLDGPRFRAAIESFANRHDLISRYDARSQRHQFIKARRDARY